jgi:hypothetical protein
MSLFDNLCENTLSEMARPVRGGVGVPGSVIKEPGFAKKEKFGGQAGKYTGAQMLQYLGDFLKDRADSEMDYSELKGSIKNFLSAKGFKGTAAEYWTRTLSQTIFDFGYKPEKPSEVTENPSEAPTEFEDGEVPSVSSDGQSPEETPEETSEETPEEVPATPQFKSADQKLQDDIYNYLKDGDENSEEITRYVSRSEIKAALAEWNKGNNILTPADKDAITKSVLKKKEKQVLSALEKLVKDNKVEKLEGDQYHAKQEEKQEGEGSGEEAFIDAEDGDLGDNYNYLDYIDNTDEKRDKEFNSMYDSIDFAKIYTDTFKRSGLIKD